MSAGIYDHLMSHVDYEDWASYIQEICDIFEMPGKTLVEAGCGTGTLLDHLIKMKYQASGFDLSFEMIQEAKRKYNVPVWQGDLRFFALNKKVDGLLCLYDSIQYLSLDEFPALFDRIHQSLSDHGLFIFDIVTEMHILTYWKHSVDKDETDRFKFNRKSWYDPVKKIQHTEIECYDFVSKNAYIEHHQQHIFDLDDLMQVIVDSNFTLEGMLDDFTFNDGHPKSDRIHFVLKKDSI